MLNLLLGAAEPGAVSEGHLDQALEWIDSLDLDCRVPVDAERPEAAAEETTEGARSLLDEHRIGVIDQLSSTLRGQGVRHAVSGTAAANRFAPFLTSVPFVGIWVAAEHLLEDVTRMIGAEPAERGANVMLMRARDDTPLAFSGRIDGVELANVFRIYLDARRDQQRGAEQAEHLRSEVIGF